jgi:K+-dependent Na+/Ca+ exchanger-like protein
LKKKMVSARHLLHLTALLGSAQADPAQRGWSVDLFLPRHAAQQLADVAPEEERRLAGEEGHLSSLDPWMKIIHCDSPFDCHGSLFGDSVGGMIVDFLFCLLLLVYMFKGLGEICDAYFMTALENISEALNLSNDVAGATFMAAGSSAPELFTSVVSTFFMVSDAGVGTIIGSAIFNIFVIVGATGYIACKGGKVLDIWWYPLSRDTGFYIVAIAELAIVLSDDKVYWYEAVIFLCTYALYIGYMFINPWVVEKLGGEPGKVEEAEKDIEDGVPAEKTPDPAAPTVTPAPVLEAEAAVAAPTAVPPGAVEEDAKPEPHAANTHGSLNPADLTGDHDRVSWSLSHSPRGSKEAPSAQNSKQAPAESSADPGPDAAAGAPLTVAENGATENGGEEKKEGEEEEDEPLACIDKYDPISFVWRKTMPSGKYYWSLFFYSVFMIMGLSYIMVDCAIRMGTILTIEPFIMGLLVLSAGTSIPDTLSSIAVAKQGEGDMAISNALGSNVFDILLGLGVPWLIKLAIGREVNFPGASTDLMEWIIILCLVVVLFFGTLMAFKWKLNQKVGLVMLSMYLVYVTYALVSYYTRK